MKFRSLAAVTLIVAATPALASGIDSRRSPYPPSAYPGYVGHVGGTLPEPAVTRDRVSAYRYSGPHAGGPANDLPRY